MSTVTGTPTPVSGKSSSGQVGSQKNGHNQRPRRQTRSMLPSSTTRSPGENKYWSTNA
jgi:hypothetical protein